MLSTRPQSKRTQSRAGVISAQDILQLQDSVFKNGMLRKKGKKLNVGKWPHRLVVLTYDSIYVFNDEAAKSQNSKFCLAGYNQVARCEVKGQQWCFSIVPAANIDSLTQKTFACVSDTERKEWMTAIKGQLYAANQIHKPKKISDKFNSIAITDVDGYIELERLVYSTTEGMDDQVSSLLRAGEDNDDWDDDDDDNSSAGSQGLTFVTNKPQVKKQDVGSNKSTTSNDDTLRDYESLDEDFLNRPKFTTEAVNRQNSTSQMRRPSLTSSSSVTQIKRGDSSEPPRYSAVLRSDSNYASNDEEGTEYANMLPLKQNAEKTAIDSLESLCTIVDPSLDRDQLIAMLSVKEPGTYLIRKSRQGDQKVISMLGPNQQVREYKIYGTPDRPSLDESRSFSSLDDLLRYYTLVETLPRMEMHLKKGIHQ